MKIAIVGSGISGLGAAWLLSRAHEITVYEAAARPGGHSSTVEVEVEGRALPVDTGFIVYNEPNYPNLTRLFAALGVETAASDMSFAVSLGGGRLEYAGSAGGLFAQKRNLLRPKMWRMTADVLRFFREAESDIESLPSQLTLAGYLERKGYSQSFAEDHLLPMGAAIWSCASGDMLRFPARSFLEFYRNHGLLNLNQRPQWRTVSGGSRAYVRRLLEDCNLDLRLANPVRQVRRDGAHLTVIDGEGRAEAYDQVIFACHGDQARAILGDAADPETSEVLAAFRYQRNQAVLHSDPALMPRRRSVWSSWNYLGEGNGGSVAVTYWMNRLQNLAVETPVLVSLNPLAQPAANKTWSRMSYDHPLFDAEALAAQRRLPEIQGRDGMWFCGSYCGHGFHEDGLQAGIAVAEALGCPPPWRDEISPISPAAWTARPAAANHDMAVAAE